MWPLISRARMCRACSAASSGVSANFTPPAFMRPPVRTWDLMTVGPPISPAMRRASSLEVAKPCGETGIPALATIFRDSYSKNLMGGGSLSWPLMRLVLTVFLLLACPATAAAADLTLTLDTSQGVRYGSVHEGHGILKEGTAALGGQPVEIEARAYPYDGAFKRVATVTTAPDGSYTFGHRFDRNGQIRAFAPAQAIRSNTVLAYVFPRPRSTFKAVDGGRRLRMTQFLRTPADVRLTARTIFYLGPKKAKSAPAVASAKPRRIAPGRFQAIATVRLPPAWGGTFRYGSCFRYSAS